jgi:deoxyribodipyrimidine photolyase-related protein
MKEVTLIFPHQLFAPSPLLSLKHLIILLEEFLFFKQYAFHQQKILFHRASMKAYADELMHHGHEVNYIDSTDYRSDIRKLVPYLAANGCKTIHYIDPTDQWLSKRLKAAAQDEGIILHCSNSPLFLNSPKDNEDFFRSDKKKFYQTTFYKQQREKRNILIDGTGGPQGGKWTYDTDNRKKYPAKKVPPFVERSPWTQYHEEAESYVIEHFSDHLGTLGKRIVYPVCRDSSKQWFEEFLSQRFHEFGTYEDAIVQEELILHHSLLSPLMNVGLLHPQEVIDRALEYAFDYDVPLNTLEGFVRQIIGWREFIRGVYESVGSKERTRNFWGFNRKIPSSFYDGSTGILPIDSVIKKVLETGYCHHIERLMVLGNFMLLCEFDPDEVYRWFMELFIDAFDWVMVTNVYGMSQFADGGLMSTKPYISSSNYLMKMSNYKKGEWQETWDALFWRFMHVNRAFFLKNPRLSMLVRTYDKMDEEKRQLMSSRATQYLDNLDSTVN